MLKLNAQITSFLALALIGSAALAAKAQQPKQKTITLWSTTGAQVFCDQDVSKEICINSTTWNLADGTTIRLLRVANP